MGYVKLCLYLPFFSILQYRGGQIFRKEIDGDEPMCIVLLIQVPLFLWYSSYKWSTTKIVIYVILQYFYCNIFLLKRYLKVELIVLY